jgi:PAS domain S-box-containing protein
LTRSTPREKGPLPGDLPERILDLLDDGIVITGESGDIIHLNSAMERLSGLPGGEALGRDLSAFIASAIAPRIAGGAVKGKEIARHLTSGGDGEELEFALPAEEGERWFSASSRSVTAPPSQGGRVHVVHDITRE